MKYSIAAAAAVIGFVSAMPAADNDWEKWSTTTITYASTTEWEKWTTTTPKADEWTTWKKPEPTCYSTSVYKTKDCDGGKDEWGNCKEVEKTSTYYDDKYCSKTWEPVVIKTPEADWNTWKAPKPTCYSTSVYKTKDCGDDDKKWDNCKEVEKTSTYYDDKYCKTWDAVVIKTPEAETTWAPATIKTPEAETTWATWAKSSTVSAPVAKWTGAADKQAVGMGAIAIAALAAFF